MSLLVIFVSVDKLWIKLMFIEMQVTDKAVLWCLSCCSLVLQLFLDLWMKLQVQTQTLDCDLWNKNYWAVFFKFIFFCYVVSAAQGGSKI